VDEREIRRRLIAQFGIRVEPEMSRYVLRRINSGGAGSIPIMGGDARTGVAVRTLIDFNDTATDAPTKP